MPSSELEQAREALARRREQARIAQEDREREARLNLKAQLLKGVWRNCECSLCLNGVLTLSDERCEVWRGVPLNAG